MENYHVRAKQFQRMLDTVLENTPTQTKTRTRSYRRAMSVRFKEMERAKNASWQRGADAFKKTLRRKGDGRARKYKGKVMPTAISLNDKCSKEWSGLGNYGESMKMLYLYLIT